MDIVLSKETLRKHILPLFLLLIVGINTKIHAQGG